MTTELPETIREWEAQGRFFEHEGCPVWYRCDGAGPWLVVLHGFPTSSWDFHRVLEKLSARFRVLLFDFPGYGLSGKPPNRNYSLMKQCDTVLALLADQGIGQAHVLAHDMGATVAAEWLHRRHEGLERPKVLSVTLLNGGIYPELHRPLPTQRLLRSPLLGRLTARFSGYPVFRNQYPKVYSFPEKFDEAHYRTQWALMRHNGGRAVLAKLAGYMRERQRYGSRWWTPLEQLDLPFQIVWGHEDPIAVPDIAERLQITHGKARLSMLAGVGHYPQLEAPDRSTEAMFRGLRAAGLIR